jgi:hypothetical protein
MTEEEMMQRGNPEPSIPSAKKRAAGNSLMPCCDLTCPERQLPSWFFLKCRVPDCIPESFIMFESKS